jgi:hypothetical protein
MRYKTEEIEDQLVATLQADKTGFDQVTVRTHAGEVNVRTFLDASALEGFVSILPFALIQYQGRRSLSDYRDSPAIGYVYELTFRIYIGAKSLRAKQEAQRSAYEMLRAVWDDISGHVIKSSPQTLGSYANVLDGDAVTSSGFNPQSPFYQLGGADEKLIVNLPQIVVYQSDWVVNLQA